MKKIIYKFFLLLIILFNSCSEDFLDKKPLDEYSEVAVWNDLALIETFVNDIYNSIPHGFNELMFASISDEAILTYNGGSSNITNSLVSPTAYYNFSGSYYSFISQRLYKVAWDWVYKSVRACNLALEQIEKHTYDDEALLNRILGEIHFLRAYHYQNLVFMYGGVPIITKAYELDEDHMVARNTFEECIEFIKNECEMAADLLPVEYGSNDKGRATKGAALALKSRVLLWAASDLYHEQSSWSDGYGHPELIGYVGGDRTERWRQAKNAAKAVMDLNAYELHKSDPASGDNVAENYAEIFVLKETVEDIFVRFFTEKSSGGQTVLRVNTPNGYYGYGGNTPTSQTADVYEMNDGSKFDWDNPIHKADPYKNREPRFYANIFFEGAKWRERSDIGKEFDPVGVIQVAYYQTADGEWIPGADTRSTPYGCQEDGTYTGYYMRKFLDITKDTQYENQECPWRFIRYAEVILNYAEACNELGEDAEALEYINMIRHRAGLPDISVAGEELQEKIRHERQVELMFEDHRYYDIRRWMIAPQVLSTNAMAVDIKYYYGEPNATYTFHSVRDRAWKNSSYFMPIMFEEMQRNNLLIQNPLH